ncbi:hypothetical protein CLAFUW4_11021 [Fulvia fulva]|nr:hypothetical protein CLAFUR4_11026 [Fulvia fulva]WPV17379.1 hypothetical protein CLAFUW4_11021 [Fulvia fulva]
MRQADYDRREADRARFKQLVEGEVFEEWENEDLALQQVLLDEAELNRLQRERDEAAALPFSERDIQEMIKESTASNPWWTPLTDLQLNTHYGVRPRAERDWLHPNLDLTRAQESRRRTIKQAERDGSAADARRRAQWAKDNPEKAQKNSDCSSPQQ